MPERLQPAGILPCQSIEALIATGAITAGVPFLADQVQPASLDLRLGARAWRVRASFLPGLGRKVADRIADVAMHELDLTAGAVLERQLGGTKAANRLDGAEHTDDAVEAAAAVHGVGVRTRHDGAGQPTGAGQPPDEVGSRVGLDSEACFLHPRGHPLAPGSVETREDSSRPAGCFGVPV